MSARGLRDRAREGTVHFMGIGGAGMCALAELFHRSGYRVTGCDLRRDLSARSLEALGVSVATGHHPDHLDGVSAIVISSAISPSNPEVRAARERGIPVDRLVSGVHAAPIDFVVERMAAGDQALWL